MSALLFCSVGIRTPGGAVLLDGVDWRLEPGQHWALLGANGAGKSTLLSIAGGQRHPSTGSAELLGERFGRTDLRELRARIGVVDHTLRIPASLTATEVVVTGRIGSVHLIPGRHTPADHQRARELLAELGCGRVADRPTTTWSHGERARVRIARALITDPPLLLLDEPASGLDLPGREDLVAALERLARSRPRLATVLVTHHVEELPSTVTHALLLRDGHTVASGVVDDVLTDEHVSRCFDRPIAVRRWGGRWSARAGA